MSEEFDPTQYVTTTDETSAPAKKKWGKAGRSFDTPVSKASRRQAQVATGRGKSIMSGQYKQVNTRLPPEWYDEMVTLREEIGCSMEQLKRWMMGYSLEALRDGVRPRTRSTQSVEIDDFS